MTPCIILAAKLFHCFFFFFSSRRRHTRYWRDWSSDVCSSDLPCIWSSRPAPGVVRALVLPRWLTRPAGCPRVTSALHTQALGVLIMTVSLKGIRFDAATGKFARNVAASERLSAMIDQDKAAELVGAYHAATQSLADARKILP